MAHWVSDELRTVELGDRRLEARYRQVLERLADHPQLSLPAALKGRTETQAAYRLFGNKLIDPQRLLAPHFEATFQRLLNHQVVLVVQDTTEIQLVRPKERVGGPINSGGRFFGVYAHPLLAFTPKGLPLGLVASHIWARDPEAHGQAKTSWRRPIEQKESARWLEGYREASRLASRLGAVTSVVAVADSESDIYDCLAEVLGPKDGPPHKRAHLLVRACHDRCLLATGEDGKKLRQALSASEVLGGLTVDIRARPARSGDGLKRKAERSARRAKLVVRAKTLTLKPPQHRPGRPVFPPVTINAVLVSEVDPPTGEPPIDWLLLTDLATSTWEDLQKVIEYYCARWGIETYFKVLKSGCRVEELQLETTKRFKACLAIYMIVAWRVMFVQMLGRESFASELTAEVTFTKAEWEAVFAVTQKRAPPSKPPPLRDMVRMLASLGGFLGRKRDGEPGPKVIWIGLQRMRDLATGWEMRGQVEAKILTAYE
jgi:hypothetical protein